MATTVRSSSIGTGTGSALSVAAPAGTSAGDLVIVVMHVNNGGTIVDNNGATPFTQDYITPTLQTLQMAVFSRRIQAGDPSTYNFTFSTSDRWTCEAICFQNPHPSVIYDVAPGSGNFQQNSASTNASALTITTLTANAIHISMCGFDGASLTISATPAGYTVQKNGGTQVLASCTKVIAAAGATGATAYTCGTSAISYTGSFAIRDIGGVTVALTGQSATFSTGGMTAQSAVATAGASSTVSAGALAPNNSDALSGVAITSSAGTLAPSESRALIGSTVTFAVGQQVAGNSEALSAQTATFSAGTTAATEALVLALVGPSVTFSAGTISASSASAIALTGSTANFAAGALSAGNTKAITGASISGSAGSMAAAVGKSLVGQQSNVAAGIAGAANVEALSGASASFTVGTITSVTGLIISLSGQTASFSAGNLAPFNAFVLIGRGAAFSSGNLTSAGPPVSALWVRAVQSGYYQGLYRPAGDEFMLAKASDLSDASVNYGTVFVPFYGWMEVVNYSPVVIEQALSLVSVAPTAPARTVW